MTTHFARLLKTRRRRRQGPRFLPIGIAESGILHNAAGPSLDLTTRFQMVKKAGVFDFIEAMSPPDRVDAYLRVSEKSGMPIRVGGGTYVVGRDEKLLEQNLRSGVTLGSKAHNVRIPIAHADGCPVSDREVMELYLWAYEIGAALDCKPCLGLQIDTWAEDFRRVSAIGARVQQRAIPFRTTLDAGDVVFKIDNPRERVAFGIGAAVEADDMILDPTRPGHLCEDWIARGYVRHCHARPAIPNNPASPGGRGTQYPFIRPTPGTFCADWSEARLTPWKAAMRQLMAYHASHTESRLGQVSVAFGTGPDRAGDCTYSLFENAVACASWLREAWLQALATEAARAH